MDWLSFGMNADSDYSIPLRRGGRLSFPHPEVLLSVYIDVFSFHHFYDLIRARWEGGRAGGICAQLFFPPKKAEPLPPGRLLRMALPSDRFPMGKILPHTEFC